MFKASKRLFHFPIEHPTESPSLPPSLFASLPLCVCYVCLYDMSFCAHICTYSCECMTIRGGPYQVLVPALHLLEIESLFVIAFVLG